jgi:cAMP-dependent protein kinase regulator
VVGRVEKGMLFGEIALLHNIRRTATVKCVSEGKVWYVTQESYLILKLMDEKRKYDILKNTLKERNLINQEGERSNKGLQHARCWFLCDGECVDASANKFFVVVCDGAVRNGERRDVKEGDVLEERVWVVGELEGYYVNGR